MILRRKRQKTNAHGGCYYNTFEYNALKYHTFKLQPRDSDNIG